MLGLGEAIIQEKLTQERGDSANAIPVAAGSSSATGPTPAPGPSAGPDSSSSRRTLPERSGAESDAELVNAQHLQVLYTIIGPVE